MSARRILPFAMALALLAATLVAAHATQRYEGQRATERADAAGERAAAVTQLALATSAGALSGAAGLFEASESVQADEFAAFSRRVLGLGGLAALGWLERVPGDERSAWESRTGLRLLEPYGAGTRPARRRAEHFPITYLATTRDTGGIRGLDPTREPARRAALRRAAASGAAVATAPVRLYGSGARGVILFQPVYRGDPATPAARRAALRGYAVGAYRLDTLVGAVARAVGPETPVALRDGDLLLSSGPPPGTTGAPAPIALPGRAWTAQAARPAPSSRPALLVLASGGLLSLLALTIAIVIARRDRFATAAVDRATRDVRESRESLRALATNSPDVIARYDRGLRCVFMNPAIRDATGLAPERFVGRTSAEAGAPQELVALWEDALRRVLAGEEDVELDFAFPTEAGERWFHSRLAPEHDAEGAIAHVLVTSRDVTSQTYAEQALRRSEDRYRSLVESMSDGVVVQDASGAIVSSNSAAEGILGLSAGQLAGRDSVDPRWRAIAEDGAPLPGDRHPAMRTLRSGVPLDAQIMGVHRPDGSLVWLSVSTRLRDDDGGRGVIACFTDITARVEADREQAALRRVATAVAEHRDQPALLALVARETAELIGAEAAGVVRFDDALTGTVMGVHAPGHVGAAPGSRVDLSLPTAAGGVAGTGRVARVGGGGSQHPNVLVPGVCVSSAVAAPIRVDNRLWGAIAAVTTQADDPLGPATADRLERMGHLISLAVMSSDARARLATLASTDELTGLPNRRSFMRRLREEIERAGRHERPLSLVMIDVDHFKRINDTLGHGAGDRVLMGVAATLFRSVRDSETVARVGGEEFAWILPETDGSGAVAAGERVRASLADVDAGAAGPVTASMGVCVLSAGMDAGDLMRCADAALYRAKESGRDRVVGPAPGSVGST